MTKACIYVRVSTREQDSENQSVVLTSWAAQRRFDLVGVYQEQESAWKSGHQGELARIISDARKGKFEVLLVWALDRLSREGSLAILSLIHKLAKYGVKVLSYQESWTEAPGELAELLYALAGWAANMESTRRSERTKAGLSRAMMHGSKLGRPKGSKDRRRRKKRSPKIQPLPDMKF